MNPLIKGYYRDILTDSQRRVFWDSGWRSNRIVQNCNRLLAALMKRHEGMQGIAYWAIGVGEADWDSTHLSPLSTTSQLTQEVARQAIATDQIVYLDDANEPTETPSNQLEITAEFQGESNASQPLREFGLFGGDATEVPDSGLMIDYVIHPRIDLTPGMALSRQLRLTFAVGALQQEEWVGFGASLPMISIDGVGEEYASTLGGQGIDSLGDLVEIDPLLPLGNIPQVRLREFRAKARTVMGLRIDLTPFMSLADRSISLLLMERPEDLVEAIDTPAVTPKMVTHLQEELAVLQIALDDTQLQRITLGDLISA